MKRVISTFIMLLMWVSYTAAVSAEDGILENLEWNIESGHLTITGNGAIINYKEYQNQAPWSSYKNNITKITVGEGVNYIGSYAFVGCRNVTEVVLPSTVEHISMYAFNKCHSLERINLPEGITYIGDGAFRECYKLKNVVLPQTLKNLGDGAFYDCWGLETITIPDSVTVLGDAFWYCKGLKTIDVGKNANIIFNNFPATGCEKLESINVAEENMYLSSVDGVLFDYGKTTLIKYPAAKAGDEYSVFESVRFISYGAFEKNRNLKNIIIKGTVEEVDRYAFNGCEKLENIIFEKNPDFKSIEMYTIGDCSSLKEIIIPGCVNTLESYAFSNNPKLESVVIPKSVKNITSDKLFFRCANITDIYYMGTREEWNRIEFDGENILHDTAVMHFSDDEKTDEITIRVNGGKLNTDVKAYIKNERTMVPLRAIFEALNAEVLWDDGTKTVTGIRNNVTVKLTIGDNKLYKNGEVIILDAPAEIADGRTMVPVRAISEAFGASVMWDDVYKTVRIVL